MSADVLEGLASKLFHMLQAAYFERRGWGKMKDDCHKIAISLQKYAVELRGKK